MEKCSWLSNYIFYALSLLLVVCISSLGKETAMTPSYFVTLYNVFRSPMGTEIVIFTVQSDKVKLYNNIQQAGCRLHRASLAVNY